MRRYTSLDLLRYARFSKENEDIKPMERLKKYNKEYPELSDAEKLANLKKWINGNFDEIPHNK